MATVETPLADRRFEHLLLDFLAYLEFERGLSRNTLDAYRSDLLQYGRFLEERDVAALGATAADIADFLEKLATGGGGRADGHDGGRVDARDDAPDGARDGRRADARDGQSRPVSPATIHRKSACLRSFYRHLRRDGLLDTDPTATLSAPRRTRKLPQVLTRGEV
jgi:integrase/recombinase XerD